MHLFHVLLTSGCVPAECMQCFCQSVKKQTNKKHCCVKNKVSPCLSYVQIPSHREFLIWISLAEKVIANPFCKKITTSDIQ